MNCGQHAGGKTEFREQQQINLLPRHRPDLFFQIAQILLAVRAAVGLVIGRSADVVFLKVVIARDRIILVARHYAIFGAQDLGGGEFYHLSSP